MTALWIVGAGGHGAVVADAAQQCARWHELLFFDDRWPAEKLARGLPIGGDLKNLFGRIASGGGESVELVVAIGNNSRRLELSDAIVQAGARLATVIHPHTAVSPSASVGAGSVVLAGAVLNPGAEVGRACIVNTRASVDHDCRIGAGVHICPGVTLAGNVSVDDLAWIGVGSCAIEGVIIGRSAMVAAGATVIAEVASEARVAGCPAREMKSVG